MRPVVNSALLACMFCIQTEGMSRPPTPDTDIDESIIGRRSSISSVAVESVKERMATDFALRGKRYTIDELEDRRAGFLAGFEAARRMASRIAAEHIIDGVPHRTSLKIHLMGEEEAE